MCYCNLGLSSCALMLKRQSFLGSFDNIAPNKHMQSDKACKAADFVLLASSSRKDPAALCIAGLPGDNRKKVLLHAPFSICLGIRDELTSQHHMLT